MGTAGHGSRARHNVLLVLHGRGRRSTRRQLRVNGVMIDAGFSAGKQVRPEQVVRLADGSFVVRGFLQVPSQLIVQEFVARYTSSGQPDPAFGSHGVICGRCRARPDPDARQTSDRDGLLVARWNGRARADGSLELTNVVAVPPCLRRSACDNPVGRRATSVPAAIEWQSRHNCHAVPATANWAALCCYVAFRGCPVRPIARCRHRAAPPGRTAIEVNRCASCSQRSEHRLGRPNSPMCWPHRRRRRSLPRPAR